MNSSYGILSIFFTCSSYSSLARIRAAASGSVVSDGDGEADGDSDGSSEALDDGLFSGTAKRSPPPQPARPVAVATRATLATAFVIQPLVVSLAFSQIDGLVPNELLGSWLCFPAITLGVLSLAGGQS